MMKIFKKHGRHANQEFRTVNIAGNLPPGEVIVPEKFVHNKIVTSKYTFWNFIFKNLFEQFRRIANFYFLCIAVIQLSINSPVSPFTSMTPLIFVVVVTAVKQGYEDWRRHRADNIVNTKPVFIVYEEKLLEIKSKDIKVGDIVMVQSDEEFPCDLVMLSSSNSDGYCYITTANLDGETNLKVNECLSETKFYQTPESFTLLHATIECEQPLSDLYTFVGRMKIYENDETKISSLGSVNLLLKGARLKNTNFIYGCAVYTGQDTKMALNLKLTSNKFSTVEKSMNKFLVVFLIFLITEAFFGTCLTYAYRKNKTVGIPWYLPPDAKPSGKQIVEDFLSFLVLFNYIIPISLYVTLEMVKFIGSKFFVWDLELYDEETREGAVCNTSDLNEELGQVQYLFTDKTGTLTENDMTFRHCSINGLRYTEREGKLCSLNSYEPVKFYEPEIEHFLVVLALCNTVQVNKIETNDKMTRPHENIEYQASSPDEKALVEACRKFNVVLHGIRGDHFEISVKDVKRKFQRLHTLEFDSDRKRMSVIVQDDKGKIYLFCKGAESGILERTISGPKDVTESHINEYALAGLRILLVAERVMSNDEYRRFDEELREARSRIINREQKVSELFNVAEQNLNLLGATAVEDRLQDGVCETLSSLRAAGIKIWVLTGDKKETAVNVSYSCGHFNRGMNLLSIVAQQTTEDCECALQAVLNRISEDLAQSYSLVIDGASLIFALSIHRDIFYEICCKCTSVLCCRMSPLQKAEVVRLIKSSSKKPITAAIGDGANDVSMIQEAHVGLGIIGKEGRQAVRCSDFAFSKFRFLRRVLLVHGQYYYMRISNLVQYFFYKNIAFIAPQFYYIFFNGFSPQPVYHSVFLMLYNIVFTSLPIFVYGVCEQHLPQEVLLTRPELYKYMSGNSGMTIRQFLKWVLQGYWHSAVIFVGAYLLWFHDASLLSNGQVLELWSFGSVMFHCVVMIVNLKLSLHTHYWTAIFSTCLLLSIFGFIIFTLIFSGVFWPKLKDYSMYWVYFEVLSSAQVWFGSLIMITAALLPDVIIILIETHRQKIKRFFHNVTSSCYKPHHHLHVFCSNHSDEHNFTISHVNSVERY